MVTLQLPKISNISISSEQSSSEDIKLNYSYDEKSLLISVQPPTTTERTPLDIVCVIDISGSMDAEAVLKTEHGAESDGLSNLDIVKNTLLTIVNCCDKNDRLSLVTFSNEAKVLLPLTTMDDAHKKTTLKTIKMIVSDCATNIWDGLLKGMDQIVNDPSSDRVQTVFILTDGHANVTPPKGEENMLMDYLDLHPNMFSIQTFGFSQNINSKLIDKLAILGNGSFNYIHDAAMVSTTLTNALANTFVTVAESAQLTLELKSGISLANGKVNTQYVWQSTSWGTVVTLGNIQNGQSKDILFDITGNTSQEVIAEVYLKYKSFSDKEEISQKIVVSSAENKVDKASILYHSARQDFIGVIREFAFVPGKKVVKILKKKVDTFKASPSDAKSEQLTAMISDMEDQGYIAFGQYYKTWGRHYLLSLSRAYTLQQCNNFKDKGVQFFGGPLFKDLRSKAEKTFLSQDPPTPSVTNRTYYGSARAPAPRGGSKSKISWSKYHSANAPCFHGHNTVILENGRNKRVDEVKKDDVLPGGSRIVCVLKTHISGSTHFSYLPKSRLLVTPWHPVKYEGHWVFPEKVSASSPWECDSVYSFVLDKDHVMIINGVECVTLGHDFKGDIREHVFFGSLRCIDAMQNLPGWRSGLVEISGCSRDPYSSLINGFIPYDDGAN